MFGSTELGFRAIQPARVPCSEPLMPQLHTNTHTHTHTHIMVS